MSREMLRYIGDGIRAPEIGELVGKSVTVDGRHGKVVKNDHFTITVEWDKRTVIEEELPSLWERMKKLLGPK